MKNIVLSTVIGFGLVGCAATNDLLSGQFSQITPQSTELSGYWTGSNGPYLVTYKFKQDGTGLMCYSYNDKNVVERIKVVGDTLYNQNGLKQSIKESSKTKLTLKANYYVSAVYSYEPDNNLQQASPFCAKELKTQ